MSGPEPSTQMTMMSEPRPEDEDSSGTSKEQKIREIVVLPAPEVIDATEASVDEALAQITQFVRDKTAQCKQLVQSSSAVSFTANYLQPRIVSSELGARLAKLYEALEVKKADDFEQKLDQLTTSSSDEPTAELVRQLRAAFSEWAEFLAALDTELDRVAGPEKGQSELGQSGKEIQLVSQQGRLAQNGSLLSYVQSSSYSLMFLEVVASFAVQECYEHVKRMFDSLPEFNKLGCDILLLTRRPASGGGGFLKLIGMPFRMLLNESESMRQILMHRQSAQSMAGLRALHIYTEFLCNDQPLEIHSRKPSGGTTAVENGQQTQQNAGQQQQQSGCILLDRQGRILYSYLCTDSSDWPDVEVLLEQVRLNQHDRRPSTAAKDCQPNGDGPPTERPLTAHQPAADGQQKETAANGGAATAAVGGGTSDSSGEVAVHKRKCCTIM